VKLPRAKPSRRWWWGGFIRSGGGWDGAVGSSSPATSPALWEYLRCAYHAGGPLVDEECYHIARYRRLGYLKCLRDPLRESGVFCCVRVTIGQLLTIQRRRIHRLLFHFEFCPGTETAGWAGSSSDASPGRECTESPCRCGPAARHHFEGPVESPSLEVPLWQRCDKSLSHLTPDAVAPGCSLTRQASSPLLRPATEN